MDLRILVIIQAPTVHSRKHDTTKTNLAFRRWPAPSSMAPPAAPAAVASGAARQEMLMLGPTRWTSPACYIGANHCQHHSEL